MLCWSPNVFITTLIVLGEVRDIPYTHHGDHAISEDSCNPWLTGVKRLHTTSTVPLLSKMSAMFRPSGVWYDTFVSRPSFHKYKKTDPNRPRNTGLIIFHFQVSSLSKPIKHIFSHYLVQYLSTTSIHSTLSLLESTNFYVRPERKPRPLQLVGEGFDGIIT